LCSRTELVVGFEVQKMGLQQIYWAVSGISFVLSLLILWFIVRRLERAGYGQYRWILYGFLLVYGGYETIKLVAQNNHIETDAFFYFWGLLSAISFVLLGWEVKRWTKKRETEE